MYKIEVTFYYIGFISPFSRELVYSTLAAE